MNREGDAIASHNGSMTLAAPATADLANTLAKLETWSPRHRFVTRVYATGKVRQGVLRGSVWVQSSMPADLLWETSHEIAARLQERGIHTIEGNLAVIGSSHLNFDRIPLQPLAGINVRGDVRVETNMPTRASLLLSYPSQPLLALLKARNTFGRNAAAETLAEASTVESGVFATVNRVRSASSNSVSGTTHGGALATSRIRVGDSTARQFSALATATLLSELQERSSYEMTDLLPTVGLDADTLGDRDLPFGTAVKLGTASGLVTMAGVLPDGTIFVTFNQGTDIEAIRAAQDRFVRDLASF